MSKFLVENKSAIGTLALAAAAVGLGFAFRKPIAGAIGRVKLPVTFDLGRARRPLMDEATGA